MDSSTIEGCGALIYATNTGRFLFLLRPGVKRHKKSWGLAGGKLEAGETIGQCLVRELQEEIAYDATNMRFIPIEKFTSDDEGFVYHTFVLPVPNEFCPVLNHEHIGYCWTPLEDYPKPLHPGVWRSFNFAEVVSKIHTLQDVLKGQPLLQTS